MCVNAPTRAAGVRTLDGLYVLTKDHSMNTQALMAATTPIGGLREDAGKLLLRASVALLVLLHGIDKLAKGPGFVVGAPERAGLPGGIGYLVYVGEVLAPLLMLAGLWT